MRFFVDTANVDDIRKANDMGIICGVTTNPSLIAKEGRDYAETLKEIASIVDGPISGEVKATTEDAETMIEEGRAIYALDPAHMVVKIPMTAEGLKAIKALSAEGIPTNCTLIFSANQALLAARAGASYVSPFLGRLDDINESGADLIAAIAAGISGGVVIISPFRTTLGQHIAAGCALLAQGFKSHCVMHCTVKPIKYPLPEPAD